MFERFRILRPTSRVYRTISPGIEFFVSLIFVEILNISYGIIKTK